MRHCPEIINLVGLYFSNNANEIRDWLLSEFEGFPPTYPGGSHVTKYYAYYNYLMMTFPGMTDLFHNIRETFHTCNHIVWDGNPPNREYFIQAWLNYYTKGEKINWHNHLPAEADAWHGFYCVDVEPNSHTSYKIHNDQLDVKSEDNLLVMGRSGDDYHRSSDWNEDKPRITIAFDISPVKNFTGCVHYRNEKGRIHYWIPI